MMSIGALLGGGLFITTIVAGSVYYRHRFLVMRRPFLRDVIFYIVSAYWILFVLWRGQISQWEAFGFLALYGFYALLVVSSRFVRINLLGGVMTSRYRGADDTTDDGSAPIIDDDEEFFDDEGAKHVIQVGES